MIKDLKSESFKQEVLNNKLENRTPFILVDFFATWCGPCRMIAPILEEIDADISNESHEFHNKISIAKVDIDESSDIATDYSVMSVPTLIIFKEGKEVHRITGFTSKQELMHVLSYVINEKAKG